MFDIIVDVWGVEGLLRRMRMAGGEGGRYSCMLEIAHNDEDTKSPPSWKNNVMSL